MLLNEIHKPDVTIFCDMDGVLVDFIRGVEYMLAPHMDGGPYSEERYETDNAYAKMMWDALHQFQADGGEFWYELNPMIDAPVLWEYINQYPVEILSATGGTHTKASEQKKKWVGENLDPQPDKINLVEKARYKAQFAHPNAILIDDKPKAIDPFVAAGGIGILHTSAASTINELNKIGL